MVIIKKINFGYKRDRILFNDLDLELNPGNIYGLLGKNGAGKTSLLKIISGLVFPKSGSLEVFGFDPTKRLPAFLQDIFFIPEEFPLQAVKIKDFVKANSVFYPSFNHVQLQSILVEFGLDENQKLNQISYGQKKTFLIAFGIACNSRLLLLDEPTNGLDIPSKSQFRKLIASSITEDRIFIISTHQVRDLENIIDPIIIVENGSVVLNASSLQLSSKLHCKKITNPNEEGVLYVEETLGGYNAVISSDENNDNHIDIELLFSAVLSNQKQFLEIFK
jgi:ABC-2 type transport system ATP-binding protein